MFLHLIWHLLSFIDVDNKASSGCVTSLYKPLPPPFHEPAAAFIPSSLLLTPLSVFPSRIPSWLEAGALSVHLSASSTSECLTPSSSTWAWRCVSLCVCGGRVVERRRLDLHRERVCIDTSGDNEREQWYGQTGRWTGEAEADPPSPCIRGPRSAGEWKTEGWVSEWKSSILHNFTFKDIST